MVYSWNILGIFSTMSAYFKVYTVLCWLSRYIPGIFFTMTAYSKVYTASCWLSRYIPWYMPYLTSLWFITWHQYASWAWCHNDPHLSHILFILHALSCMLCILQIHPAVMTQYGSLPTSILDHRTFFCIFMCVFSHSLNDCSRSLTWVTSVRLYFNWLPFQS